MFGVDLVKVNAVVATAVANVCMSVFDVVKLTRLTFLGVGAAPVVEPAAPAAPAVPKYSSIEVENVNVIVAPVPAVPGSYAIPVSDLIILVLLLIIMYHTIRTTTSAIAEIINALFRVWRFIFANRNLQFANYKSQIAKKKLYISIFESCNFVNCKIVNLQIYNIANVILSVEAAVEVAAGAVVGAVLGVYLRVKVVPSAVAAASPTMPFIAP